MEKIYPKSYGGYSYEIMDEKAYERFWWGKRPSSKEAFEAWLFDPHKTQHQIMKMYGKKNITFSNVGYNIQELMKAGIIRRFKREGYVKGERKKRRGEFDIFAEILYLANEGGVTKTTIVYQVNLNFTIVERHLSNLLERGLIEIIDELYETTDRGVQFLHHYEEIEKLGMAS
ncbi:unnamed protein product [marine sediment metagenome]|uniref:ArnR1-like winged helix-turn-helix domain-containing protein n=2 Tax=marine sediment metagenome TaxID=412755 RepID=X1BJ79_9ZZZZ